jgi:hypothetical protein
LKVALSILKASANVQFRYSFEKITNSPFVILRLQWL